MDDIEINEEIKEELPLKVEIVEKPKKIEEAPDDDGYYENKISKEEIEDIEIES